MSIIKELRDAQYRLNKAVYDRLNRKRVEKRWVINKKDFDKDKAYKELLALRDVGFQIPLMEGITPPRIPIQLEDMLLPDGKMGWIYKTGEEVMQEQFTDAAMAWGTMFESLAQTDFQPFGSAPVRNAYWKVNKPKKRRVITKKVLPPPIMQSYDANLLSKPAPQMTAMFMRYPSLMPDAEKDYYGLDVLVKALLGFPQPMGYKPGNNKAILDDSWTVNLRSSVEEDIMVVAFLQGFAA